MNDPLFSRNSGATTVPPTTRTAAENEAALLRATHDAGLSTVGKAVGIDKSNVSRFFTDETRLTRAQLLWWLDSCGLMLVQKDDSIPLKVDKDDWQYAQMLARRVLKIYPEIE